MQVIRKRLWADEGAPSGTRYNQDTDQVETTPDGGLTWNPDPGSDPRSNIAYQLPPSPDGQCAAAAGMIVQMRIFVTGMGQATLLGVANTSLLMLLFVIPGAGWLFGVAVAVASAVLTAGVGVIAAAFTEPVWEQLLCILYCNIRPDGTVTQADLDAIQADVVDQCGSTVAAGTALIWRTWGFVGLTNAGIKNADPLADCDSCECGWCYTWDFTVDDGGWTVDSSAGTWVSGQGWQSVVLGGTSPALLMGINLLFANSLRSFLIEYTQVGGVDCQDRLYYASGGYHALTSARGVSNGTDVSSYVLNDTTTIDIPNIWYNWNENATPSAQTITIHRITITGDFGDNPFGTDNC